MVAICYWSAVVLPRSHCMTKAIKEDAGYSATNLNFVVKRGGNSNRLQYMNGKGHVM